MIDISRFSGERPGDEWLRILMRSLFRQIDTLTAENDALRQRLLERAIDEIAKSEGAGE